MALGHGIQAASGGMPALCPRSQRGLANSNYSAIHYIIEDRVRRGGRADLNTTADTIDFTNFILGGF